MAWTKENTFETGDTSDFDSTSGAGLSVTAGAKYAGTYGLQVVTSDSADSYGSFTSLGYVRRAETEFYVDPNSGTFTHGLAQLCRVVSRKSNNVAGVYLFKNSSTYYLYGGLTVPLTGRYLSNWATFGTKIYGDACAISDAYTKVRLIYEVASRPSFVQKVHLYITDAYKTTVASTIPEFDVGVSQLDWGAIGLASGDSGTIFMDNISWASSEMSVSVPLVGHTEAYPLIGHAEASMKDQIWVTESPTSLVEGDTRPLAFTFEEGVPSSPTIVTMRGGVVVTGIFTGSATVSGNTVITPAPAASSLVGGQRIVVSCTATINGATQTRKWQLNIRKRGDEQ